MIYVLVLCTCFCCMFMNDKRRSLIGYFGGDGRCSGSLFDVVLLARDRLRLLTASGASTATPRASHDE